MEYFQVVMDMDFPQNVKMAPLTAAELAGKEPISRSVSVPSGVESGFFADFLTTRTIQGRYRLISNELKELYAMFNPKWEWMPAALIDQHGNCRLYWFWNAEKIACLSDKTIYSGDNTVKTLAINTDRLKDKNNFSVETRIETIFVVRLDLAESMLRRGFIGFKFQNVMTVGG